MKNILELDSNEVIHCSTPEENEAILKLMDSVGLKWSNGKNYLDPNEQNYHHYKKNTCYYPREGQFSRRSYFSEKGFTIYKATDFINVEPNYEIY